MCEKHGASGFIESCEHIRDLIISGNSKKIRTIKAFEYQMLVCKDCINRYNLEKYILDPNERYNILDKDTKLEPESYWKELDEGYKKMKNRIGWCIKCYNELLEQYKSNT